MPFTKNPAINYASRDNIVYPGTAEQAAEVERQAQEHAVEMLEVGPDLQVQPEAGARKDDAVKSDSRRSARRS